ncbi:MAG TPA: prepilin-type N-terminal cleavage/methylation domain-containing protein [Aquificaceae bacterium]|nr:prepilin-type N-terminal cleavage/methylation domain-containing protein [Aquificaceae bacterium]HIQ31400.1 prepilin-type N-terminal cleavage/methylation domain-containing protein [Aquifex aeolicus]
MSSNRAFTLVEVLLVLTLLGLTFSTVLFVFLRGIGSSLSVLESSEKLSGEASLFWDLQRKVFGASRIKIENDRLYMITSGGTYYEGVVRCAYFFREGKLYYYEFPYPWGEIDDIEESKAFQIATVGSFEVSAVEGDGEERSYDGLPERVVVRIGDTEFIFDTMRANFFKTTNKDLSE